MNKKNINIINQLSSYLASNKKIYIAYSGGLDSSVLLHLLVTLREKQPDLELTAIHINHNLSSNAEKWEKHCRNVCNRLRVKYISKNVDAKIKIADHSPEEIARKLRYEVFSSILPKNGVLVTAHHANDQVETLLLQLFRGSGPKGLAAMPTRIKFAQGWLVRPLLSFSREELLQYAKTCKLKWIEDESNSDVKFKRNLIRHRLMPLLKQSWPGILTTLQRVADHCAEANELLEDLAAEDLVEIIGKVKDTISINALKKLTPARQHNVLRFWLHRLKLSTPSTVKLNEIIRTIVNSRKDAVPVVKWHGAEVRRFQDHIYAMLPLENFDNKMVLSWNLLQSIELPGGLGKLRFKKANKKFAIMVQNKILTVRFRQEAEELNLPKRQGTHKLKKLMQEWQIPPWLRDRIPLVYCDDELIAVVGYYEDKMNFVLD